MGLAEPESFGWEVEPLAPGLGPALAGVDADAVDGPPHRTSAAPPAPQSRARRVAVIGWESLVVFSDI
jgi:hypothetical protein